MDVQVRLLQCFYLLSRSRIHHCWTIFGVVVNQAFVLDLNRKESSVSYASTDLLEVECRKRVFWTAYTLDKYLSCALGRPQAFNDEDTDQVRHSLNVLLVKYHYDISRESLSGINCPIADQFKLGNSRTR